MATSALAVQTFPFDSHAVRTHVDAQAVPWFCLKDVCAVLEISKYREAANGLENDERVSMKTDTLGGEQEMTFVSESGLYALIFQSRKPVAKQFRKWVTSEVLPALRRSGFYGQISPAERLRASSQAVYVARLLSTNQDAFVRRYLVDRLQDLSSILGQALPDITLLGQTPKAVGDGRAV